MSDKLTKELKEAKQKEHAAIGEDSIIEQAETILLQAHDEEVELLAELGLDHHIQYERKLTEDYRRTKKAEHIYATESFTGKQIKDICQKYYLKLLPVQYYNGSIPADLVRTINEFYKERNLGTPKKNHLYILAPIEQFQNVKFVPQMDPILFYKEPDRHTTRVEFAQEYHVFNQVHNWGDDFTWKRRLMHMFNTSKLNSDEPTKLFGTVASIAVFFLGAALGLIFSSFGIAFVIMTAAAILNYLIGTEEAAIDKLWNTNKV